MGDNQHTRIEKHQLANKESYNGGQLFLLFVKERLKDDNPELNRQLSLLRSLKNVKSLECIRVCTGLEEISEHFQDSEYRQKTRAEKMAQHSREISEREIKTIVNQVLSAAPQNLAENIIVVFFFMYDLMMRMYSKGIAKMDQVLGWSYAAVLDVIDPKVALAGGWAHIFTSKNKGKDRSESRPWYWLFWKRP